MNQAKNEYISVRLRHAISISVISLSLPMSVYAGIPDPQNIAINEVYYKGDVSSDWVELINRGNETINIDGWRLCARFVYPVIETSNILSGNSDLILEPGEIVVVSTGIDLNNEASDLGLYTAGPFDSEVNMVDFVQWGTDEDVGRSDVASSKGIWLQLQLGIYDFVATATGTDSLSWCGEESGGAFLTTSMDFINASPTPGSENPLSCDLIFENGFE